MLSKGITEVIQEEVTEAANGNAQNGEIVGTVDMPVSAQESVPVIGSIRRGPDSGAPAAESATSDAGLPSTSEEESNTGTSETTNSPVTESTAPSATGTGGEPVVDEVTPETLAETREVIQEDTQPTTTTEQETGEETEEETQNQPATTGAANAQTTRNEALAAGHTAVQQVKDQILGSQRKFGLIKIRDRAEVAQLKEAINMLTEATGKEVPQGDEALYAVQIQTICEDYQNLISCCDRVVSYIKGKRRPSEQETTMLEMIPRLKSQSQEELDRFTVIRSGYLGKTFVSAPNWMEAIYQMRAVSLDMENVRTEGAGTSILYIQENPNGTSNYIKEAENLAPNNEIGTLVRLYLESRTKEVQDRFQVFIKQGKYPKIDSNLSDIVPLIEAYAVKGMETSEIPGLVAQKATPDTVEAFGGVENVKDFLSYAAKKNTEHIQGKDTVKMTPESTVSDRNVSTSRAAETLGLGNIVARSETVMLSKEDGTMVHANSMEGVTGEGVKEMAKLIKLAKDNGMEISLSGTAAKELFELQIFDLICGETDRHEGNYMAIYNVSPKNEAGEGGVYNVTGIKAIDNDMSFGTLGPRDIVRTQNHAMPLGVTFDESGTPVVPDMVSVPFISRQFYDKIMSPITADYLKFEQMDIRSKEELDALKARFQTVQTQISALVTEGKMMVFQDQEAFERMYRQKVEASARSGNMLDNYITRLYKNIRLA